MQAGSFSENDACLELPERVGLPWSNEQYAGRFDNVTCNTHVRIGDAHVRPCDMLRGMMKLARRLVDRRPRDSVYIPPHLRCDAPAHPVIKKKLLTNYPGFLENFISYPDALDVLLASPMTKGYIYIYIYIY